MERWKENKQSWAHSIHIADPSDDQVTKANPTEEITIGRLKIRRETVEIRGISAYILSFNCSKPPEL